jgi:hypothetical protein
LYSLSWNDIIKIGKGTLLKWFIVFPQASFRENEGKSLKLLNQRESCS